MKRVFLGFSVQAPWPDTYPRGRIIEENVRHITCAFLGNINFAPLEKNLPNFPCPTFLLGPVGVSDKVLFLPKFKPRVVAHQISWFGDGKHEVETFQKMLLDWLASLEYSVDRRPLLPHVTLARAPFEKQEWEEAFEKLPFIVTGIHLYESLGNLRYTSIWEMPLLPAFEEFEHTADIAFHIRGKTLQELYRNGAIALSFTYPPLLSFIEKIPVDNLDQVVRHLNAMISACDLKMGCPFKAVSYHGKIKQDNKGLLHWAMIVDV